MGRNDRPVGTPHPRRVLDWLYATRLAVSLAVFGSAVAIRGAWLPGTTDTGGVRAVAMAGLVAAAVFTAFSYFHTHLSEEKEPTLRFFYLQAILDVLLVTGIVHITGGSESVFPPLLYVALVSGYAVLVPFRAALIIWATAGAAYVADVTFAYPQYLDPSVFFQIGVFLAVAAASSVIGGRLREVREELHSVEGALRMLRLDTADVLRSLGAGVITLDEDTRVAYMNPAAEDLLGLEASEWLNRDVKRELQRRAPGILAAFRDTLRQQRSVGEREVEVVRPAPDEADTDGNADGDADRDEDGGIPVGVTSAYLWRSGARASVTLVLQDLRPVRQLEEVRLQADRLQAVAELSASLAHEIRNPLASIRSAVEQLAVGEDASAEDQTLARLVVRESERLDRLLAAFGDFAGITDIQREPVDLPAVFRDVVVIARQHPLATDAVELEEEVRDGVDDLWGDEDLLHQALLNLVLNAVQVWTQARSADDSRAGESLTVRMVAETLPPDLVPPHVVLGSAVRIRVVDDGPGIESKDLDRIFDPFFSRRSGGTGLGLSIVYRTVRAHGGSVTVTSTPGERTVFEIALPRRDTEVRLEDEQELRPAAASSAG